MRHSLSFLRCSYTNRHRTPQPANLQPILNLHHLRTPTPATAHHNRTTTMLPQRRLRTLTTTVHHRTRTLKAPAMDHHKANTDHRKDNIHPASTDRHNKGCTTSRARRRREDTMLMIGGVAVQEVG